MTIYGQRGVVPIGGVVAWLKSFTYVPTLSTQGRDEWVEVNGAAISDVQSPLNGQTLPDLNGTGDSDSKFLRGMDTSGSTGGTAQHYHCGCESGHCHCVCVDYDYYSCAYADTNLDSSYCAFSLACHYHCGCTDCCCVCITTDCKDNIPPWYGVVWIVRIK